MKKILISTVIISSLCSNLFAKDHIEQPSIQKIGIVNPVEIYQSVPQGENSRNILQEKLKPQADKLKFQQNKLIQKKQKLDNDAVSMQSDDIKKKQSEYIAEENQFQKEVMKFRQHGSEQEQKLAENFQESFNEAVSEVAQSYNYDLILSSQAVAYIVTPEKDITMEVIEKMKVNNKSITKSDL